jgi:uncharacterized protein (TIGR02145 family)
MKKVLNLIVLICFLASVATLHSCKKEPDMPTLTTTTISNITINSASSGGNVTKNGGAEVTARGVCWGTAANPVVTAGSSTSDGTGTGSFTSSITGLTPNTLYHVRAYATNEAGTAYGDDLTFTTVALAGATITTTTPASITATGATTGGNVTADGGATVTERGIVWATTANPTTTSGTKIVGTGTGTGTFTVAITGLQPGTQYHVRAYATNSVATTYGADAAFTTVATKPSVTTADVTTKTQTTATAGGEVTATGGAAITERGVYWGTVADPVTHGTKAVATLGQVGTFTCSLINLTPGTKYYVRAFATNSSGTEYGTEKSFDTDPVTLAVLTTTAPAFVETSATQLSTGGNISSAGGGTVTERGVCYSLTALPDYEDDKATAAAGGTGSFTITISGLTTGATYYIRAYAKNEAGVAYGDEYHILTRMSDADQNIYKTILIGNQVWMAENLATTKYNDGANIPNITSDATWTTLATGAYAWYENNMSPNKALYGALYNWFAVNTGDLCPTGWHVATDADFKALEMTLGMTQAEADGTSWRGTNQGVQMKSTTGWTAGNGTNTSGFTAVPGGYRYYDTGAFYSVGSIAYLWSSTPDTGDRSFMRQLDSTHNTVERANADNRAGKAVRCVK